MSKNNGVGKLLFGLGLGVGLGLLVAPKSGEETRKELKSKLDELCSKAKDIDKDEIKENIVNKVNELKKELESLDKEKVTKIAKKQAANIQKKAEELYEYALEKGTPVVEGVVEEVKNQAIKYSKEITKKLESTKKA